MPFLDMLVYSTMETSILASVALSYIDPVTFLPLMPRSGKNYTEDKTPNSGNVVPELCAFSYTSEAFRLLSYTTKGK